MNKKNKRAAENVKKIDPSKQYEIKDAVEFLKDMSTAKFDETVELHFRLGVDGRHADQQIRGAMVLPHGTGKSQTVLVIAKGDKAQEAEEAGADYVGAEDMIEKIQKENWLDFDIIVATPDMMGMLGRLGRVLGPKGLMPNPKSGTVTFDVARAVKEIKMGKIEYRLEKANMIHTIAGKLSFETDQLVENIEALMDTVIKAKPASSKGIYIKNLTLTSTMGPGIKLVRHL